MAQENRKRKREQSPQEEEISTSFFTLNDFIEEVNDITLKQSNILKEKLTITQSEIENNLVNKQIIAKKTEKTIENIIKEILIQTDSKNIDFMSDFIRKEVESKHDAQSQTLIIKKINYALNFLKETLLVSFGTPHDFETIEYTESLFKKCFANYKEKIAEKEKKEGEKDANEILNFIDEIYNKIASILKDAFKIKTTVSLSNIWQNIRQIIYGLIKKNFDISIPEPILYEFLREETDDDDDGDGGNDNPIQKLINASHIKLNDSFILVIDTIRKKVLRELIKQKVSVLNLRNNIGEIDGAPQPKSSEFGVGPSENPDNCYFKVNNNMNVVGLMSNSVEFCVGPFTFKYSDGQLPIQIYYKGDLLMNASKNASVTKISNQLFDLYNNINLHTRSNSSERYGIQIGPNFDKKNNEDIIINALLCTKGMGDKVPIDLCYIFNNYNPEDFSKNFGFKPKKPIFSSGDLLAVECAINYSLSIYNRPNGRTDFYVPSYYFSNPLEELLNRLYKLKTMSIYFEKNKILTKIDGKIKNIETIKESGVSYLKTFLQIQFEKYKRRIKMINDTINQLLRYIVNGITKENFNDFNSELVKIGSFTFSPLEFDDILYTESDDFIDFNTSFNLIEYTTTQPKIRPKIIEFTDFFTGITEGNIDNNIFDFINVNQLNPNNCNVNIIGIQTLSTETKKLVISFYNIDQDGKYKPIGPSFILTNHPNFNHGLKIFSSELEKAEDAKLPTDPLLSNTLNKESICVGLPQTENGVPVDIPKTIIYKNIIDMTLQTFTISDFLNDIIFWDSKNNRFLFSDNILEQNAQISDRPSRTLIAKFNQYQTNFCTFITCIFYSIKKLLENYALILKGETEISGIYSDISYIFLSTLCNKNLYNDRLFDKIIATLESDCFKSVGINKDELIKKLNIEKKRHYFIQCQENMTDSVGSTESEDSTYRPNSSMLMSKSSRRRSKSSTRRSKSSMGRSKSSSRKTKKIRRGGKK